LCQILTKDNINRKIMRDYHHRCCDVFAVNFV
jgi:hypothetical protein